MYVNSYCVLCLHRCPGWTKLCNPLFTGLICIQFLDIRDLLSDQQIRAACEGLPYDVEALQIECLHLGLPDVFHWRLDMQCDGCTVDLKQKAMPQVRDICTPTVTNHRNFLCS